MQTYEEVLNYAEQEDIKFIRLSYFDVFGNQKNIAIMPGELRRAFEHGIPFDASVIRGFGEEGKSDLFLRPDPTTLSMVPWRPAEGGVCRMFCRIYNADGTPFEKDTRYMLAQAEKDLRAEGYRVRFSPEVEFYVFRQDENGMPTEDPIDQAGYMDVAPLDRGENLRRDICFALLEMGITPQASHHEQGPGQNEVDFRYSSALSAADNTVTLKWAVQNLADANGMWADFSPKPLRDQPGSGLHIGMSVESENGEDVNDAFMAGILRHIRAITLFLNPTPKSYERFGVMQAPYYVSWSSTSRTQLIRIPADPTGKKRIELRSPDPMANPYLAYALLLRAGLDGIHHHMVPERPMNVNLYRADPDIVRKLEKLPSRIEEAAACAEDSDFVKKYVPQECLDAYLAISG